jgi:hypothetical protein
MKISWNVLKSVAVLFQTSFQNTTIKLAQDSKKYVYKKKKIGKTSG